MKTLDYLHLNEKKVADVVSALHQLLADFQVHYTNLRGFHWDIKGHGFFVLHGKFEDMYNDAAEKVDEIAERILMLGGTPENKFSEYLKVAKVKEISGITCGGEFFRIQPFPVTGVIRVARERHCLTAEQSLTFLVELCLGVIPEPI